MPARIYARFSDENQRETSIDDQVAGARALAQRLGVAVDHVYADRAISGTRRDRAEFLRLVADARAGRFKILLLWDLKRLSRGEDLPQLLAELRFLDVRIVTCDGFDSALDGADLRGWFEGMVGNRYLKDLAIAVHRGLVGQFTRQLSAGGMPYGYRPVTRELGQDLEIDPAAADVVRGIYARYLEGWSPQRIVHDLNARRIPAPRRGTWVVSALYGHPTYQTGILRNPIYGGRYIWNRSQWVRDPRTGKRQRRERARNEWMERERPELRIVPVDVWEAAHARITRPARPQGGRPPRTPLSGLLRCGSCGGAVVAVSLRHYGCAAHKDRGPAVCAGVRVPRAALEAQLLQIVREDLLSPEACEQMRAEAVRQSREGMRESAAAAAAARKRLAELEGDIARLVDGVTKAGWSHALAERLRAAEAEREAVRRELAAGRKPAPAGTLVPRQLDRWQALVRDLPGAFRRAADEARAGLKEILGEVRLTREGEHVYIDVPDFAVILTMVAGDGYQRLNPPINRMRRYRVA